MRIQSNSSVRGHGEPDERNLFTLFRALITMNEDSKTQGTLLNEKFSLSNIEKVVFGQEPLKRLEKKEDLHTKMV